MKKLCMILFSVIFFTAFSAAQTGGDQGGMKGDKKGGGSTITGCLSGPNGEGVYELKSGRHTAEVGGNDELSKHVGHEVKLHGMWEKSGAAIGEKEGTAEKGEKGEKGERHFRVSSIDMVAESCTAGTEHHGKKGSSSPTPPPK